VVDALRGVVLSLCAALAAAFAAHVGIDIAGDYWLPHDTYDDIGHGSRLLVAGASSALFLGALAAALGGAIREARGSERAFAHALRRALAFGGVRFYLATIVLALLGVVSMEAADAAAAGIDIDGLADLFGGSIALGSAFACVCALISGAVLRALVAAVANVGGRLVRILVTFCRRALVSLAPDRTISRRPRARAGRAQLLTRRRSAGRAPPRFALAISP
jgi:hypothetical protein